MKKQTLLFLLMLVPLMASAYDALIDGIYYNLDSKTKQAEVTNDGYSYSYYEEGSYEGNVVIPETVSYEGVTYSITSIGNYAFQGCSSLTSVAIPNSVTSIGQDGVYDDAFSGCTNLSAVHITDIVAWCKIKFARIDDGFYLVNTNPLQYAHHLYLNGELVKDLVIPEGVTTIERYAFSGCSDITSVTIPNSMVCIKDAFGGCTSLSAVHITDLAAWCMIDFNDAERDYLIGGSRLTDANPLRSAHHLYLNGELVKDLVIPDGVSYISDFAFSGASDITSVAIPGVTNIGAFAFSGCTRLSAVHITDIAAWCRGGYCYVYGNDPSPFNTNPLSYAHHLYLNGELVKDLVIPDGVSYISNFAFSEASDITSVAIPESVRSINEEAFYPCSNLTDVFCYAETVPDAHNVIFGGNTTNDGTLHVPSGSIDQYQTTYPWSQFKNIVSVIVSKLTYFVDGIEYKSYEYEEGKSITPEPDPTKEGYYFSGWSEIPKTMPAHDVTITGCFLLKPICATPTITFYPNGKIKVESATEGATCVTNITASNAEPLTDGEINLNTPLTVYTITAYATKEGYDDSEVATSTFRWEKTEGDMNGDGMVNISDVVKLVNMILGQ